MESMSFCSAAGAVCVCVCVCLIDWHQAAQVRSTCLDCESNSTQRIPHNSSKRLPGEHASIIRCSLFEPVHQLEPPKLWKFKIAVSTFKIKIIRLIIWCETTRQFRGGFLSVVHVWKLCPVWRSVNLFVKKLESYRSALTQWRKQDFSRGGACRGAEGWVSTRTYTYCKVLFCSVKQNTCIWNKEKGQKATLQMTFSASERNWVVWLSEQMRWARRLA